MNIFLSLSAAPGITSNKLVVAVYDSSAPSTVVASQVFNAPHSSPVNVSFTGLSPIIYIVKTWESTDGSASGVLRHSFIATPENDNAVSRADLMITADTTSGFASNQNQYIDTSLAGWNYTVTQRGVGDLVPGVDIQKFLSGGWQFINGYVIQPGEVFTLRFQPTITVQSGLTSQSAGQLFSDEVTVTADITMDATYLGKVIKGAATSAIALNLTLPTSASSANMKMIRIMSEGGAHTMINIKTQGSDVLTCLGASLSVISIAQDESVDLYNYNGNWRVNPNGDFLKMVGELVYSFSKLIPNTLVCNGQTLLRAQYPRLWNWIQNNLDSSLLISDANWNLQDTTTSSPTYGLYPGKVKFSSGDGTTTFRLPVLGASTAFGAKNDSLAAITIGGFLRGVDDTQRLPGTVQVDGVGNFSADITGKIFQFHYSGLSGEGFTGLGTSPGGITPIGNNTVANVLFGGKNPVTNVKNYETRPFNIGAYLLIRY